MADSKEPPAKKLKKSNSTANSSPSPDDIKEILRNKLKFEMPQDFLDFWDFCKELDSKNPQESLKKVLGLELVGPFDFLARRFVDVDESRLTSYHLHWRYFYDPPEFITVISGDDKEGFHVGYYRDDPKDKPVFLCSNKASVSCEFTVLGGNLFAAVNSYLSETIKKTKDKSKGNAMRALQSTLKSKAQELKYPLEMLTPEIKARNKKVVTKTFHKVGVVVPIDANEVGYRPLTVSDGELKRMLKNISDGKNQKAKEKASEDLQEIITFVQFANDECDYGMGLELGLDLFCFGDEKFHNTILNLAPLAYQLLGRPEFAEVMEVHLKHRKRESLSQIPTK